MSANNFIRINRKSFTVSDCDADTGYGINFGQGKTLDKAIDLAQEYQEQNTVEYAQFSLAEENRVSQKQKDHC